jgi:hypothetical protein
MTQTLNIYHGQRITNSVPVNAGVGLKASHGRASIVEIDKDKVSLVVNTINKCWYGGMKEGRVTASRQDWLLKAELI